MIANYHTHNRWCKHAVGEIEDYVKVALDENFVELAITDHVPHLLTLRGYDIRRNCQGRSGS